MFNASKNLKMIDFSRVNIYAIETDIAFIGVPLTPPYIIIIQNTVNFTIQTLSILILFDAPRSHLLEI